MISEWGNRMEMTNMRPYGSMNNDPATLPMGWNYAPTTKDADLSPGHRRITRRIYNHKTRRALNADLRREMESL